MQENVQELVRKFSGLKEAHDKALAQLREDIGKRGYCISMCDSKRADLRGNVIALREEWSEVNDKLKAFGVDTKKMM